MSAATSRRPVKIAIMALGGQGGGVLADWIVDLVERAGYLAQSTSVPGVAQRTGATIYYVEAFPEAATAAGAEPVMALMPVPGDVDIVIAAELMEGGRASLRGLVSKEATTVIASTHRIYAIGEKSALGDGRARDDRVLAAVRRDARVFVGFDMQAVADEVGGVISAPLFGALAGSAALPIERTVFEETIREAGVAVETNLKAFGAAYEIARAGGRPPLGAPAATPRVQQFAASGPIAAHIRKTMPASAQEIAIEGARRCADYQSLRYAELYLSRLFRLQAACRRDAEQAVLAEVARHLALWMTYEDAIRVADLKTRKDRFERVRTEAGATAAHVIDVSEFLHPRVEEICDILPASVGRFILARPWARKTVGALFSRGRRVHTTRLAGFLQLYLVAMLRPLRPGSLRYRETQEEIEAWLARIAETLPRDPGLAAEIAASQRLLKGYGDTLARGRASYARIVAALGAVRRTPDPARTLRGLCDAALADEEGAALAAALNALAADRTGGAAA